MFQRGSRASAAFDLPTAGPLHSSSTLAHHTQRSQRSSRSTPTTPNRTPNHSSKSSQRPSPLILPGVPVLGSSRRMTTPNAINQTRSTPTTPLQLPRTAGTYQPSQQPSPQALNLPGALGSSRQMTGTEHRPTRNRRHRQVHFDIPSETSASAPSSPMVPPPLRVRPMPLPSVRMRTPIVIVESDTETASSISDNLEVRYFFLRN